MLEAVSVAQLVFIINVNVLFLSNSQRICADGWPIGGVYHQCQCSLFKQFTTYMSRCGISL